MKNKKIRILGIISILVMSVSMPVVAAASSRRENIKSTGRLEFENKKVCLDSSDLVYLAEEIDSLENTYKQSIISSLNGIGTYFLNDGTLCYDASMNEADTEEEKKALSFDNIIKGIQYSQSISSIEQMQATDAGGNLLYYETEEAQANKDKLSITITDTGKPVYYQAANINNLSAGTAAWVNGVLVKGNGADNKAYEEKGYRAGYTQGIADGLSKVNIQYTYHVHEGSPGTVANGCYTQPKYHGHSAYGGSCYSPVYHRHGSGGCEYKEGWRCDGCIVCATNGCVDLCGGSCGPYYYWDCGMSESQIVGYSLSCGLSNNSIVGYSLGCGKTTETIETATIIY